MRIDERLCLFLALVVLAIFVGGAWWMAIAQLGVGERTVPPGYWRGMAIYMGAGPSVMYAVTRGSS